MAKAINKTRCITCGKERAIFKCGGCQQDFCYNHSTDHRQELSKQLDEIGVNRDLFRQTLTEQTEKPQDNLLMQQIDQWERDSIKKVQQTAEKARQELLEYTSGHIRLMETKLSSLTDQLRQSREENDFVETDLQRWKQELTQFTKQLAKPSNITIREDDVPLVTKISVHVSTESIHPLNTNVHARWAQKAVTIAGNKKPGDHLSQLNHPHSVYVHDEQTVYVADCKNHRIVEWKYGATSGRVVAGGDRLGNRANQLNGPTDVFFDKENDRLLICDHDNRRVVQWFPRNNANGQTIISNITCYGLIMDDDGFIYVSDWEKNEVRRWRIGETSGVVVAGGNRKGNQLDQLCFPTYLFVDKDRSVYVSDTNNHRVMKWMKGATEGIVVAGGYGEGNAPNQLSKPFGIIVDQLRTVYVADYNNNRVIRWSTGATTGVTVIGSNDPEDQADQLNGPGGLSIDRQGNLYVVDNHNHRVQKFDIISSSPF